MGSRARLSASGRSPDHPVHRLLAMAGPNCFSTRWSGASPSEAGDARVLGEAGAHRLADALHALGRDGDGEVPRVRRGLLYGDLEPAAAGVVSDIDRLLVRGRAKEVRKGDSNPHGEPRILSPARLPFRHFAGTIAEYRPGSGGEEGGNGSAGGGSAGVREWECGVPGAGCWVWGAGAGCGVLGAGAVYPAAATRLPSPHECHLSVAAAPEPRPHDRRRRPKTCSSGSDPSADRSVPLPALRCAGTRRRRPGNDGLKPTAGNGTKSAFADWAQAARPPCLSPSLDPAPVRGERAEPLPPTSRSPTLRGCHESPPPALLIVAVSMPAAASAQHEGTAAVREAAAHAPVLGSVAFRT